MSAKARASCRTGLRWRRCGVLRLPSFQLYDANALMSDRLRTAVFGRAIVRCGQRWRLSTRTVKPTFRSCGCGAFATRPGASGRRRARCGDRARSLVAEQNFAFARLGVKPARQQREMLGKSAVSPQSQTVARRSQDSSSAASAQAVNRLRASLRLVRCGKLAFRFRSFASPAAVRALRVGSLPRERGSLDISAKRRKHGSASIPPLHRKYGDRFSLPRRAAESPRPAPRCAAQGPASRAARPSLFQTFVQRGGALEIERVACRFAFLRPSRSVSARPWTRAFPARGRLRRRIPAACSRRNTAPGTFSFPNKCSREMRGRGEF